MIEIIFAQLELECILNLKKCPSSIAPIHASSTKLFFERESQDESVSSPCNSKSELKLNPSQIISL